MNRKYGRTCSRSRLSRLGAILALCFSLSPVLIAAFAADAEKSRNQEYKGKVVSLADLVKKAGGKLDDDAKSTWMALITDDGKVYPLVKDDGSRIFFKDHRLLNRPMRLTGRILPNSQLLQVVVVHSYVKSELCEVYYWCDICSIKRFEKKDCDCCGAPMELRETAVKK